MNKSGSLVVSLRRIAEDTSQPDRIAQAFALFDAYKAALYRQHDIGPCNRPARLAKAEADRALADLRSDVLRAEIAAAAPAVIILTAVRHRIEMARRALAIRIVAEAGATLLQEFGGSATDPGAYAAADDWTWISGLRRDLRDRHWLFESMTAIRRSRDLLDRT
jgi:hypothetical protein